MGLEGHSCQATLRWSRAFPSTQLQGTPNKLPGTGPTFLVVPAVFSQDVRRLAGCQIDSPGIFLIFKKVVIFQANEANIDACTSAIVAFCECGNQEEPVDGGRRWHRGVCGVGGGEEAEVFLDVCLNKKAKIYATEAEEGRCGCVRWVERSGHLVLILLVRMRDMLAFRLRNRWRLHSRSALHGVHCADARRARFQGS